MLNVSVENADYVASLSSLLKIFIITPTASTINVNTITASEIYGSDGLLLSIERNLLGASGEVLSLLLSDISTTTAKSNSGSGIFKLSNWVDSSVSLSNSQFDSTLDADEGGVISVSQASSITLQTVSITNSEFSAEGQAIFIDSTQAIELNLLDVTIDCNSAGVDLDFDAMKAVTIAEVVE